MTDIFSKEQRSKIMRNIKSQDTKPELAVRKFLFSHGFRYRLHRKDLPGKPDIVLPKYKTVIFVNGCFWHGHGCKIGSGKRKPQTNIGYWLPKIEKNIARDKENYAKLTCDGWDVIVVWECQTKKNENLKHIFHELIEQKNANFSD
ncbi:very short patch repair endonuclease [Methanocalculus sp.]|uniref:very short patch repair endonuclease n=1 Tax=Methanocalculus sp. TaxID=2004547 RepID=UPI00262B2FB6|nr:DNA mismatch endonuclease Vsr [Methanocalculus sp.]MDG6249758.1 DNA mismatch endonuclease Vsr [Methanocalculus sp.]